MSFCCRGICYTMGIGDHTVVRCWYEGQKLEEQHGGLVDLLLAPPAGDAAFRSSRNLRPARSVSSSLNFFFVSEA